MSDPQSSPASESPIIRKKPRLIPRRLPLSYLPCRQHKLRCDRQVPCNTCSRYHREEQCLQNPAPAKGRRDSARNLRVPQRDRADVDFDDVAAGLGATSKQTSSSTSAGQAAPNANLEGRPLNSRAPGGGGGRLNHNAHGLLPVSPHSRPDGGGGGQLVDNVPMAAAVHSMRTRYHLDPTSSLHRDDAGTVQDANPSALFSPQSLSLSQFTNSNSVLHMLVSDDQEPQWRRLLVKFLPTRTQSDILLSYFIEHINWIFQTVHIPTFRKEYSNFWDGEIEDADLIWMSLLFIIISLSALYIPGDVVELVGLQRGSIRHYADTWHHVSRQALRAGNFEEHPTLTQLQTFSVTQLYWYATNNIETLNS